MKNSKIGKTFPTPLKISTPSAIDSTKMLHKGCITFKQEFHNMPIHSKFTLPLWNACGKSSSMGVWISPGTA